MRKKITGEMGRKITVGWRDGEMGRWGDGEGGDEREIMRWRGGTTSSSRQEGRPWRWAVLHLGFSTDGGGGGGSSVPCRAWAMCGIL